jgi:hypothetical protein
MTRQPSNEDQANDAIKDLQTLFEAVFLNQLRLDLAKLTHSVTGLSEKIEQIRKLSFDSALNKKTPSLPDDFDAEDEYSSEGGETRDETGDETSDDDWAPEISVTVAPHASLSEESVATPAPEARIELAPHPPAIESGPALTLGVPAALTAPNPSIEQQLAALRRQVFWTTLAAAVLGWVLPALLLLRSWHYLPGQS